MKNRRLAKTVLLATASAAAVFGCTKAGQIDSNGSSEFRNFLPGVKIVYSANVDGEIEPCGCRSNPTGGIHRRWNLVAQKGAGEKLTVDSGDLFYQSMPVPPFLEKQWNYQAMVLLRAYNAFGVEVMTPGELDLAPGLEQFELLKSKARFKIISANLYRKGSDKRYLDPWIILEKGGKKVGIFGLIDESLPLPNELEARDRIAAAKEAVSALRSKVDVVLALTHQGLEKDLELPKLVPGIDAIFGAHTQSYLIEPEKVGDTLVFQPSFRGQHLGIFHDGTNSMYQVDERFESPEGAKSHIDNLLIEARAEIARMNKEQEAEMFSGNKPISKPSRSSEHFATFPRCAECHKTQFEFYKGTAHSRSFETLVQAKKSSNLDCLKCHTVGMNEPGGWKNVNQLVLNQAGKAIDADSFSKSYRTMDSNSLSKISKAFINVQCENCHGPGQGHPMAAELRKISATTCVQCHTPDRAPGWYKGGKLDETLLAEKLKSISCPSLRGP